MTSKFVSKSTTKLPITYKKNQVVADTFKGSWKRSEVRNFIQTRSDMLKKQGFNGALSLSIHTKEGGWLSGYFTDVGTKVILASLDDIYDEEDDKKDDEMITEFQVYYMKHGAKAGGLTDYNNCLFTSLNDCLFNSLKEATSNNLPWKYPATLKKLLKLERKDPIDIKLIADVERRLKLYKINVTGDHLRTSTRTSSHQVINLKLIDGHYTFQKSKEIAKVKGIAYEEKIIMMHRIDKYDGGNIVYSADNPTERNLCVEDFLEIRSSPITSKYMLVKSDPKKKKMSLEDEYNEYIQNVNEIKTESNGLINMYKTGSIKNTALKLFEHFNKTIVAEEIGQTEAHWLQKASMGAIVYAEQFEGEAYKYDIVSHYPSIMRDVHMMFPIKAGEFSKITNDQISIYANSVPMGIYRCKIEKKDNVKTFRYNQHNYYTNYDLKIAMSKNLKIEMIIDDEPNKLFYARDKVVTGSQLFLNYVDYLFKMKIKGIKFAKQLINILWGSLTQQRIKKVRIDNTVVRDNQSIRTISPFNDDYYVELIDNDKVFYSNFSRIGAFLIGKGRLVINNIIGSNIESVKRIHTDGMVLDRPIIDVKLGSAIGDLKYEGKSSNCIVHNSMRVSGDFTI
jgi:hypothetical protein